MIGPKHSLVVGVLWLVALLPLTTFAQDTRLIEAAKRGDRGMVHGEQPYHHARAVAVE